MDKYSCHCDVKAFDGISIISAKPTIVVESDSHTKAFELAKKHIIKHYEGMKCTNIKVSAALVKKLGR